MKKSALLASSLGNISEWYDFGLLSAFSAIFGNLFFPASDKRIATLEILLVFALGFLCRPLGGLLFGHFGDRVGRAATLRASILLISIPTLLMAFLPTYQQAGIWAPILLIILRLAQGISLGGEFTGIVIYLTEIAPKNHRALLASFAGNAANIGLLTASGITLLLHNLLTATQYQTFGWRLAFILGALGSWAIFYFRSTITETESFQDIKSKQKILRIPFLEALKKIPLVLLRTMILTMFNAVFYYTCFIYVQGYLVDTIHYSVNTALKIQASCLGTMLVLVPLGGMLCDRLGRRKTLILITTGLMISAIPCFYLLASKILLYAIIAMAIFTLLSSIEQGVTSVTIVEQYPTTMRYSGISVSYNLAQAIFGGTAPAIAALLILHTENPIAPGYYLMIVAAITLFTVLFSLRETRHISLCDNEA